MEGRDGSCLELGVVLAACAGGFGVDDLLEVGLDASGFCELDVGLGVISFCDEVAFVIPSSFSCMPAGCVSVADVFKSLTSPSSSSPVVLLPPEILGTMLDTCVF